MRNASPAHTSPQMPALPTSTPPHNDGEYRVDGLLAQPRDDPASLDIDTTILPPLVGTNPLKVPMPDHNKNSGSKRKLLDSDFSPASEASSDDASDAEEKSRAGKKSKQEDQDDKTSSLIPSVHIPDAAVIESLVISSLPAVVSLADFQYRILNSQRHSAFKIHWPPRDLIRPLYPSTMS